eukprot:761043-Hanusia_phi.AAC.4
MHSTAVFSVLRDKQPRLRRSSVARYSLCLHSVFMFLSTHHANSSPQSHQSCAETGSADRGNPALSGDNKLAFLTWPNQFFQQRSSNKASQMFSAPVRTPQPKQGRACTRYHHEAPATVLSGAMQDEWRSAAGHRFLILRHGKTNYNAEGRIQGSTDFSRLTEEGEAQASSVGGILSEIHIDSVFVSPLTRARRTLELAEAGLGRNLSGSTIVLDDLREVDLYEWEGMLKKEIKEMYPDIYSLWRGENPRQFKLDSGKYPIRDLWKRASNVWDVLRRDATNGKTTLIVAHNGINQALLCTTLGLSEEFFRKLEFPNCGIAEVIIPHGEPIAVASHSKLTLGAGQSKAKQWRWLYPTPSEWSYHDMYSAEEDVEETSKTSASM